MQSPISDPSDPPIPAADDPPPPVKRKRGRPPKNKAATAANTPPPPQPAALAAKGKEEEFVCFVCFDGGDLVVCDRRGCPKVYHPACVNRDDDFFRSGGRWNCGWHICSVCGRAAKYMCYTCTYSLCKACVRDAKFSCIRGNKGFCETCYSTVMLIESNGHVAEEKVEVDFDDKNSWEYLFKLYWFAVKKKLTLTPEELSNARSPWKGSGVSKHDDDSSDELYVVNDDQEASSDSSFGHHEGSHVSKRKPRKRSTKLGTSEGPSKTVDKPAADRTPNNDAFSLPTPLPEECQWASPALLEFVSHMKNGDLSTLAQFDVQELLLEYIKQNNLRDPRRKSQIICDKMLLNLFGKERVGHFEMLKLIESHFLIKESLQNDNNQADISDPVSAQADTEEYSDQMTCVGLEKKRKSRKKDEEREHQSNVDDYAAIDLHNINLIYLRRNLTEDLLDDMNLFREKVVGTFVRIRIPGASQKQDMYRLVQVVGTSTVAEKYKVGKKTVDVALEILNLNKTEILHMDTISNQDFTEEECKRLRQSIKCGLIKRLTVGDIQEKAKILQAVRVNDWLESEKLRLSHLRDRASETGRRKELRLCVEKLQILSTPEERIRRLNEIPEVHVDPCMDPNYESPEEELDQKKKDDYPRPRGSFSRRNAKELVSPGPGVPVAVLNLSGAQKASSSTVLANRGYPIGSSQDKPNTFGDQTNELNRDHDNNMGIVHGWEAPKVQSIKANSNANLGSASEAISSPGEVQVSSSTNQDSKVWHYQDPSGKVQGPFSMTQLRKWSTTGYFPPDLKIWQTFQKPQDSIPLTDALFTVQKQELHHNNTGQPGNFASVVTGTNLNEFQRGSSNLLSSEIRHNGSHGNSVQSSASISPAMESSNRLVTQTANYSGPKGDISNPQEGNNAVSLGSWEILKDQNAIDIQGPSHSSYKSFSAAYPDYHTPALHGRVNQALSGQWSDAFNPPSPTPESSSNDTVTVHKPAGIPISKVAIHDATHANGEDSKEDKMPNRPVMAYPASKFDETKFVSFQKSESSYGPKPGSDSLEMPDLVKKHNPEVSKLGPASLGATLKQNMTHTTEPSLLSPTRYSKLADEFDTSIEWSLPSPTPAAKSSDWDIVAGSTSANSQSDTLSKCLEGASRAAEESQGPAVSSQSWGNKEQGNQNMVSSRSSQAGLERTWETSAEVNIDTKNHHKMPERANISRTTVSGKLGKSVVNVGWGAPSQRNADLDWEAMSPTRSDTIVREALSPVHSNAVAGWEAMSPVRPNANSGWEAPSLVRSNVGLGGASNQGNRNLNSSWRESIPGNMSPTWGAASLERSHKSESPGWNKDLSWDTSRWGSTSGSNARRGLPREDFSSPHSRQNDYRNREHGVSSHGGGRNSRYESSSGGNSRHSDREYDRRHNERGHTDRGTAKVQRVVCKYYEKGHCYKGASCNYQHPGYQE